MCVCVCARACARVRARACVRAYVCARAHEPPFKESCGRVHAFARMRLCVLCARIFSSLSMNLTRGLNENELHRWLNNVSVSSVFLQVFRVFIFACLLYI